MPVNTSKQYIGFVVLLILVGAVAALMIWPFWQLLALAAIFAVLFNPVYKRLLKQLGGPNRAAWASVFIIIIVAFIPLWLIGQTLFNELVDVYKRFSLGELVFNHSNLAGFLPEKFRAIATTFSNDINVFLSRLTGNAFNIVTNLLSNLASFFLSLFLMIFMIFFFLRDGDKLRELLKDFSPLSPAYSQKIVERLETAIAGVVKGSFLVALIQGVVGTIGYLIFGVPQPVLWGCFTVLAALVPTVGTTLAWIPAAAFLLITGHTGAGVGMVIWGSVAVGTIDNIVSPKLVGSQVQLHPLLVLLSVLGGISLFGFLGFLFGPIIMSVFVTLLDIYRKDLKS